MGVDVIIKDDRWDAAGFTGLAERAVCKTLDHAELNPDQWDIAILAEDDGSVAELNRKFRGKDQPTNVLSWPSTARGASRPGEPPQPPHGDRFLGDIALGFETCAQEADAAGTPFDAHIVHLIVHGTLHLLGYDHERDLDADLMESTEIAILAELGLPNPYLTGGDSGVIDDGKD